MSRLNRVGSETPVYFPPVVAMNPEERRFTPTPPQRGRHHSKKHQHVNDSRIQLEPLRPLSSSSSCGGSGSGSSSARLSGSLSAMQVGLADGSNSSRSATDTLDQRYAGMEKKLRFYQQLASLKLRDVVTTEQSVLQTIDSVVHASAAALEADSVVLYALHDDTRMLRVTSCSRPDVVGFQVPLNKFAMDAVLQRAYECQQQLQSQPSTLPSASPKVLEPIFVANLQSLASYDAAFDVDSLAGGATTSSVLAGAIIDEHDKPIFVVEARSSRTMRFSDAIFRACLATVENIVYQFDLRQVVDRTTRSNAALDAFLQGTIQPLRATSTSNDTNDDDANDDDEGSDCDNNARDEISVALTSNVNRQADPELERLITETTRPSSLKKLTQRFLETTTADAVYLLRLDKAASTCDVLASASTLSSDKQQPTVQIIDTDKLNTLFALAPANDAAGNNADAIAPLFARFVDSIEKEHPLDLSDDDDLRSALNPRFVGATAASLTFVPVPSTPRASSSSACTGVLVVSSTRRRVDTRVLRPFVSALGVALTLKHALDDVRTSTIQKLKLMHLYHSHFALRAINDPSTLVNMVCAIGCETFSTSRVTLYVADPIKRELWSLSTLGSVNGLRIPFGTGIAGTVASTKETLIVRNAYDDPRFDRSFDAKFGFKTESLITFAVLDTCGETLGVVQAVNAHGFMAADASPLLAAFDARVLDVFHHLVSHALQLNASLIMFAKVQADYWVNRAVLDVTGGDSRDAEGSSSGAVGSSGSSNQNVTNDVASVHYLLDSSGFDDAKRVPRNKWSTFAYAVWVLGKLLRTHLRRRRCANSSSRASTDERLGQCAERNGDDADDSDDDDNDDDDTKQRDDDAATTTAMTTPREFTPVRHRSRTASVIRAGRTNSLIHRWRRMALSPVAIDQDALLRDDFNPLSKSLDELQQCAFELFEGLMLRTTFRIDDSVLRCFLATLAGRYRPVAYHSFYHGFDVALTAYSLIRKTNVISVIKEIEALSLLVAALGHDADHPGNDNQFEVDTSSHLALCYNDISVLENHHAATTFSVLRLASCDILRDLSASAKTSVRTAIVRCILATDMKHHSRLIADLTPVRDASDFEHVSDGRQLLLNMLIHGADLGSVAHPLPITLQWVDMVCQEFTDQATKSEALGIFVPPHIVNLEDATARSRLQVNFIDYLVAPLWHAISSILPEVKTTYVEHLRANRAYYYEHSVNEQMSARRASILERNMMFKQLQVIAIHCAFVWTGNQRNAIFNVDQEKPSICRTSSDQRVRNTRNVARACHHTCFLITATTASKTTTPPVPTAPHSPTRLGQRTTHPRPLSPREKKLYLSTTPLASSSSTSPTAAEMAQTNGNSTSDSTPAATAATPPQTLPPLSAGPVAVDPADTVTFRHQTALPKLPIPTLEESCARYLAAIHALQTPAERAISTQRVAEFLATDGPALQEKLIAYDADKMSYIEDFWYEAYLNHRNSVVLNVNPFFVLEDDPTPSRNNQISRAASLVLGSLKFINALRKGTLEPDMWRNNMALCMNQYKRLFGCARMPTTNLDEAFVDDASKHIVVMCRNQFYWFDVIWADGVTAITERELVNNLKAIQANAMLASDVDAASQAIGVLTTERRANWATLRQKLLVQNAESLAVIDRALFLVCLDNTTPPDAAAFAATALHGTYGIVNGVQVGTCMNRWYDKLQIIVCENGVAGVNFEHSFVDGHTVLRFVSDVYTDTIIRFAQTIRGGSYSFLEATYRAPQLSDRADRPRVTPRKLEWTLDRELAEGIKFAEAKLSDLILQNEVDVLEFTSFGKLFITQHNMSPDAFVQIAFIAAYYFQYGSAPNVYEPVLTKRFRHGRTEAARSMTPQAMAFCDVFFSDEAPLAKLDALHAAIKAQVALVRDCAAGKGVERHLFALECIWQSEQRSAKSAEREQQRREKETGSENENDSDSDGSAASTTSSTATTAAKPALFSDDGWATLNHTILSTSNCGNPSLRLFGFGPVSPDGFGIGYIIKDEGIQFCASSKHRQTSRYLQNLNAYLLRVQDLLLQDEEIRFPNTKRASTGPPDSLNGLRDNSFKGYGFFDSGAGTAASATSRDVPIARVGRPL